MRTIYKYYINPSVEVLTFDSYACAKVISCGKDADKNLCIWVDVATSMPAAPLKVYCVGTGWDLSSLFGDKNVNFVGTVVSEPYVWHVYQEVD